MSSDIESEVKWRMGRLYSERLELRDLVDDKQDLEVNKIELLLELDNIKRDRDLLDDKKTLIDQLDKCRRSPALLKRKEELIALGSTRDKLIQELNKYKNDPALMKRKGELIALSSTRDKFIQESITARNNQSLLKRKKKLSNKFISIKNSKTPHSETAITIQTEIRHIQKQLFPPSLIKKISDLDYVQTELKHVQEQLTPGSILNRLASIQEIINKTNHISTEIQTIQTRIDMSLGTYQHVIVPGEYATLQQQTCTQVGRTSYPREGFLFDFMIRNNISTKLIIGGERSFGFNGVLFSQARTIGDDQVILYPDHNLFPEPAVDFLLNKNFNQTVKSVPFEDKPNIAVWRGGNTGAQGPVPGQVELGLDGVKINRKEFVSKFKGIKCVDAAIIDSDIGPSTPDIKGDPNWLMPHEQANNYKYIISLEGNDAGSNPRWIFSTQCVVFMSDKLTSELTCHYHLRPWEHYIPFKYDLSDLIAKIQWANGNIAACKTIIENSNAMHRLITDHDRERKILKRMLGIYKKNIK